MKFQEVSRQLIFPEDKFFNQCHASTILKFKEKLLCAWFAGTKEGKDDVEIYLSINDGEGWSDPKRMTFTETPCWNPVLFEDNGEIILFYKNGKHIPEWRTFFMCSSDGENWSDPAELVCGDASGGRGPVKNKPVRLSDGRIAAPASVETKEAWDAFVDFSSDGGKTWEKSEFMDFDHSSADGLGIIQPTLWQDGGRLYALLRSSEGSILRSYTNDCISWSRCEKTALPNNNSGIDCVKLPGGEVFVVYNPISKSWGDRNIIACSVSGDNAETFSEPVILEQDEDTEAEFSYPAVISDGEYIYITYTHYRKSVMFIKLKIISE